MTETPYPWTLDYTAERHHIKPRPPKSCSTLRHLFRQPSPAVVSLPRGIFVQRT